MRPFCSPLQRLPTVHGSDGHGCPFASPHYTAPGGSPADYDESEWPVAMDLCDHRIIDFKIHAPCGAAEMADVADGFEKVVTGADELR